MELTEVGYKKKKKESSIFIWKYIQIYSPLFRGHSSAIANISCVDRLI